MIGFDHATDGGSNGGVATTLTFAHPVTGPNPILIVGVTDNTTVHVTGVTYNGVAMTEIPTKSPIQIPGNRFIHLYYLLNPAQGSNNVVVTADQIQYIYGYAASYTGVAQSSQPDASGNNSGSSITSLSKAITTIVDNCWTITFGRIESGTITATAGTTARVTAETSGGILGDSNGPITPAGSTSLGFTFSSTQAAMIIISIAPAVGGAGILFNLL